MDQEEKRLKASLKIAEERFGPDHLNTGHALVQLAEFYLANNRRAESDRCHERIRRIIELWLKENPIDFTTRRKH